LGAALRRVSATSPRLTVACYATALAPLGLLGFAAIGGVVPLIVAMVLAAVAELAVLTQRG
jgi:hypothetical protein